MNLESGGDTNVHDDGIHPDDATLFDLVSGRLSRRERSRVQRHVDGCAQCRSAVEAGQPAVPAVPAEPAEASQSPGAIEQMPAPIAARLAAAVDAEWELREPARVRARNNLPAWRRRLNVGLAMAVVAGVLGVVVAQVDRGEQQSAAPPTAPGASGEPAVAPGAEPGAAGTDSREEATSAPQPQAGQPGRATEGATGAANDGQAPAAKDETGGAGPTTFLREWGVPAQPCMARVDGVPPFFGPVRVVREVPIGPSRRLTFVCYELVPVSELPSATW